MVCIRNAACALRARKDQPAIGVRTRRYGARARLRRSASQSGLQQSARP